ncbi:MAG: AMP-binding protein, partial [Psychrobacter sp.]|nr:AMP-binding protein [Psychrobacter sp.]
MMLIDSESTMEQISKQSVQNIITADTDSSLAYVIYTSGTTGIPKGVMIEHKNVINTLNALEQVYAKPDGFDAPLKITAFTSYAFDVSVSEFLMPLLHGDELHLLSNQLRQDILLTSKYLNDNQINYVYLPPILLAALPRIKYPSLLGIIYAGEACDKETALYWSHKTNLYNYYGPTEATIYTTGMQLIHGESHLIGVPIQNTKAYILNKQMNLQPIGVSGELYVGGLGLAKGYLNQSHLTAEKFIANPFQASQEKEMGINHLIYKTGDLARWTESGYIEYLGRNDFQVKIRGYRIELGEIEATLKKYPEIKQSVVIVKKLDDNDANISSKQYLAGYYVSDNLISSEILNEYLSLHLPNYMRPNILIHLTELPATPNGKLDKAQLPNPEFTNHETYIAPTNRREKIICAAFSNILSINKISIDDDFFSLGGNSIMAISLVSALQDSFNIGVTEIFSLKTPRKIARQVTIVKNNFAAHLEQIATEIEQHALAVEYNAMLQKKVDDYRQGIKSTTVNDNKLPISNVLLTGATGFLGCNLLNELLTFTDYSIFMIVRADSDKQAFERVNQKYADYFENSLDTYLNARIFVFCGDIEQPKLGMSDLSYDELKEQIDSIIHCAALTKHYGEYEVFYEANVQATIYLLELARLTRLKCFNYVSTISVLDLEPIPNCSQYVFTEDDNGDNIEE